MNEEKDEKPKEEKKEDIEVINILSERPPVKDIPNSPTHCNWCRALFKDCRCKK